MRRFTTIVILVATLGCFLPLAAQLRVTRQVLATTVQSSTNTGNGFLKFTAHAGEVLSGTYRGGVLATTGFQQPDDDVTVTTFNIAGQAIRVKTYPNPTIRDLTVDLTEAAASIIELSLYDMHGRPLRQQPTNSMALINFPNIGQLPSGIYILRARLVNGQLLNLSRVMVVPH